MRVKEVTYEMLRVTRQFENDRVSVTVVVESDDEPQDCLAQARLECELALLAGRKRQ